MEKCRCKNKCISFGNCNSLYGKLILGSTGLYIGIVILLSLMNANKNNLTQREIGINFIYYLFFNNLCESLMIIPHLFLKKKIVSEKDDLPKKENTNEIEKYIFNQTTIKFSKRELIHLVFFSILKLGLDFAYIVYVLSFAFTQNMSMFKVFIKLL